MTAFTQGERELYYSDDLEKRIIKLKTGKTGKIAHLPMRDMLYDVFFAGIRLNDLCYNYFQRVFARVLKKAGINDKDARLHAYRHTFASRHVKNDTPIAVFAKLMNQSNIQQCNKECG